MADKICSFCGAEIAPQTKDKPPTAVAGPEVLICRDCVGVCIEILSGDPEWRDEQLAVLVAARSADVPDTA